MPRQKPYIQTFREGLSTTGKEDGLPLPRWPVFANIRTNEGPAQRRQGIQIVDSLTDPSTALDFASGSSHHIVIPQVDEIQQLGKRWTCEYLVNPDGVSGTQVIHSFAHATQWPIHVYLNADVVTAKVTDTADTVVTLTSSAVTATKLAISVIRNGTALSLWVNGVEEDTDTMADLNCKAPGGDMYLGRDSSGNYFDGLFDFARALSVPLTNQAEGQMRLVDPRARVVLWDYTGEIAESTTKRVDDRSLNGNHGAFVGTAATGTAQSFQVTPIRGIHGYVDNQNESRLAVIAGRKMYVSSVGL